MKEHPWIFARDGRGGALAYALECRRCGVVQRVVLPIEISVWCAMAKAFERSHAQCRPTPEEVAKP